MVGGECPAGLVRLGGPLERLPPRIVPSRASFAPSPGSKTGAGKFLREMLGGVSVGAMVAARWIQQCANNALAVLHYFQMDGKAHPTGGGMRQSGGRVNAL